LIKKVFLTKEGVCNDYALSFKKICDLLLIKSYLITGYVRTLPLKIGIKPNEKNHIWNVVQIENKLIYLDVTWTVGYFLNNIWINNVDNYYFNIDHKKIEKTHLTLYKKRSLRLNQNKIQHFHNQPIFSSSFLSSTLTLIQPSNGVLNPKKRHIVFKIKNLPTKTKVYYLYGNHMKFSKKAKIKYKENIAHIKIKSPKNSTNLFLFFDKKLGLQYKVLID